MSFSKFQLFWTVAVGGGKFTGIITMEKLCMRVFLFSGCVVYILCCSSKFLFLHVLQWREGSFTADDGSLARVYTSCNVQLPNVNNWLRTPYIHVGDEEKRVLIEVQFTMRKCDHYPDPQTLQQCKESFSLLYYEAESDFANSHMPTWDTKTYRHIDAIAADYPSADRQQISTNTETRGVAITRRGVYFAFYDQGACMTLTRVRIYYVVCPSVVRNFAIFPNTTTGTEVAKIVQAEGVCVPGAAIANPPSYLCKGDGTWNFLVGGCVCMPGYEPDDRNEQCLREYL